MDRDTIARHLLSDQSDPFNRNPLTMDMLKDNTELSVQTDSLCVCVCRVNVLTIVLCVRVRACAACVGPHPSVGCGAKGRGSTPTKCCGED